MTELWELIVMGGSNLDGLYDVEGELEYDLGAGWFAPDGWIATAVFCSLRPRVLSVQQE